MKRTLSLFLFLVAACAPGDEAETTSRDAFFSALQDHCGKAYAGRVVSRDAADSSFATERLAMAFRHCDNNIIRMPFYVGEDRSRTWVLTKTGKGLTLKHDHRHEDGTEDAITQYGGDSGTITATRAEFPVDDFSIAMFEREELAASVTNVWAMEMRDKIFAYELSRPNRFFRVEFDLSQPIEMPPAPWGEEGER